RPRLDDILAVLEGRHHPDGRLSVEASDVRFFGAIHAHGGDVCQVQCPAVGRGHDDDGSDLVERGKLTVGLDVEALFAEVYTAAGNVEIVRLNEVEHLIETDAVTRHLIELQGDVDFFHRLGLNLHPLDVPD